MQEISGLGLMNISIPSIARGLSYYTGPVFETFLLDLPEIGSICSGGRYDGLVSRFSDRDLPATGMSFGVDRLFAALQKLGKIQTCKTLTQVLVTVVDPTTRDACLGIAGKLRDAGIRTQVWLDPTPFKKQMAFASTQMIPIVIICGSDEVARGGVVVRNMSNREQELVAVDQVVTRVRKVLEG